jgi:hypothetical protein
VVAWVACKLRASARQVSIICTKTIVDSICLGEWLLDPRLLNVRLDICIRGTKKSLVHHGRYENECGFIVLTKPLSNVNHPIPVRLGYTQSRVFFPPCHIYPETPTARPGFVEPSAGKPVVSATGERVVIIGSDGEGKLDYVGNYALIIASPWLLAPGNALVTVCTRGPFWGQSRYFNEKSLCRSYAESVDWMGKMIM